MTEAAKMPYPARRIVAFVILGAFGALIVFADLPPPIDGVMPTLLAISIPLAFLALGYYFASTNAATQDDEPRYGSGIAAAFVGLATFLVFKDELESDLLLWLGGLVLLASSVGFFLGWLVRSLRSDADAQ